MKARDTSKYESPEPACAPQIEGARSELALPKLAQAHPATLAFGAGGSPP